MRSQNESSDITQIFKYGKQKRKDISDMPDTITPKDCPICKEKIYPIIKDRHLMWVGCKCKTARTYKFSPPKK